MERLHSWYVSTENTNCYEYRVLHPAVRYTYMTFKLLLTIMKQLLLLLLLLHRGCLMLSSFILNIRQVRKRQGVVETCMKSTASTDRQQMMRKVGEGIRSESSGAVSFFVAPWMPDDIMPARVSRSSKVGSCARNPWKMSLEWLCRTMSIKDENIWWGCYQ